MKTKSKNNISEKTATTNQISDELMMGLSRSYFLRAVEMYYCAFRADPPPYFPNGILHAMGFELACKSVVVAYELQQKQYTKLPEVLSAVEPKLKSFGHKLKMLVSFLVDTYPSTNFKSLMDQEHDSWIGSDIVSALQYAFKECRYVVQTQGHTQFPKKDETTGTTLHWDCLASSGMIKFCYRFTEEIHKLLSSTYKIEIPDHFFQVTLGGDAGRRFKNLINFETTRLGSNTENRLKFF